MNGNLSPDTRETTPVLNKGQIMLYEMAAAELGQLRKENAVMRSRLQMFDDMMMLLRTHPPQSGNMTSNFDLVNSIWQQLEEQKRMATAPTTQDNLKREDRGFRQ